jgi:hypothetical protein
MIKNQKINVYINASKSFYYPGEKLAATILLDVKDRVNCDKMKIIAKGKQIIKAKQVNKFSNEEKQQQVESSSSSSDSDDSPKYIPANHDEGPMVEINENKHIFKVEKEIIISENKVLIIGKHSFPFEVEIPQDIPGTFLYLDKNVYAEVIYSVKIKLESLNIKKTIPIVIRQNQEVFNYEKSNEFSRKVHGCCCIVGQTSIKLTANEDFTHAGDPIKLTVNINNETNTTSTPITVEVYRKLFLKGTNNSKKIKVTKIVGEYQGKRIINAREKFQKKLHVAINSGNYLKEHINETKASKIFKHKEIIPFLFQSMKSDNITCEFEVYAESQYANITNDDLGVFLSALVYPIEDGVLSKSVMNIAKSFVNSILNKKFFLKGENLIKKEIIDKNQKKVKKPKIKKKIYEESEASQETIKFENKLTNKLKQKKGNIESDEEEEINDFNDNEINSKINNQLNNEDKETFDNNNNNITNNIINKLNYNSTLMNNNNMNKYNNNNINVMNNSNNNKIKDSKNLNSEEISFGTSTKDKNYFNNDISSNIKKDFNKEFLNDPLDDQMSDDDK